MGIRILFACSYWLACHWRARLMVMTILPRRHWLENTRMHRNSEFFLAAWLRNYDLCVKKGFLPKGKQSAEATAKLILQKMREFTPGPDQSAYVQEGWDLAKPRGGQARSATIHARSVLRG